MVEKRDLTSIVHTIVGAVLCLAAFVGIVWLFTLAIREGATLLATTLAALATVGGAVIVRRYEGQREPRSPPRTPGPAVRGTLVRVSRTRDTRPEAGEGDP